MAHDRPFPTNHSKHVRQKNVPSLGVSWGKNMSNIEVKEMFHPDFSWFFELSFGSTTRDYRTVLKPKSEMALCATPKTERPAALVVLFVLPLPQCSPLDRATTDIARSNPPGISPSHWELAGAGTHPHHGAGQRWLPFGTRSWMCTLSSAPGLRMTRKPRLESVSEEKSKETKHKSKSEVLTFVLLKLQKSNLQNYLGFWSHFAVDVFTPVVSSGFWPKIRW